MNDIWNYLISLKDAAELYRLEESTLRRVISHGLLTENAKKIRE